MASGKKTNGGGGVQFEILKNPGIDFYSGFRENAQGGCNWKSPKKNVGIDFYSGFRKTSQGGGGAILIPKKVGPP